MNCKFTLYRSVSENVVDSDREVEKMTWSDAGGWYHHFRSRGLESAHASRPRGGRVAEVIGLVSVATLLPQ